MHQHIIRINVKFSVQLVTRILYIINRQLLENGISKIVINFTISDSPPCKASDNQGIFWLGGEGHWGISFPLGAEGALPSDRRPRWRIGNSLVTTVRCILTRNVIRVTKSRGRCQRPYRTPQLTRILG